MSILRLLAVTVVVIAAVACLEWATPRDNTDPEGGRSGMRLYTDNLTGCQYLSSGVFGEGLTPRLDRDGKQICNRESK